MQLLMRDRSELSPLTNIGKGDNTLAKGGNFLMLNDLSLSKLLSPLYILVRGDNLLVCPIYYRLRIASFAVFLLFNDSVC